MRKFVVFLAVFLVLGVAAAAQDVPKVDVFGGYSFLRVDTEGLTGAAFGANASLKKNYNGFAGEAQYNLAKWVGLTADVGFHFGRPVTIPGETLPSAHSFTYLFGPTIFHQAPHARPFVHFLVGGNRISIGSSTATGPEVTDSGFSFALGGGFDLKVTKRIALRLGQADWLYTKHNVCQLVGQPPINCQNFLAENGFPPSLARPHQNNFRFATGVVFGFGER